jgi:hypothetical protein
MRGRIVFELDLAGLHLRLFGEEQKQRVTDGNLFSVLELMLFDRIPVDLGSVAAIEIANGDALLVLYQETMTP